MVTMAATMRRSRILVERNLLTYRRIWWVYVSGFFEPVLYLWSIGLGVGALVGHTFEVDGHPMSYPVFVAPAMLAAAAMNGAMADSAFNLYFRMHYGKIYDAILATPMRPVEVALGELTFAMMRGASYAAAFLAVMVAMGLTTVGWAIAALPAAVLVGFTFAGLGMALATYLRSWQDFDYIGVVTFVMFLFGGTFAPTTQFPVWVRAVVAVTPLYHGVQLTRGLTTGSPEPSMLLNAGYLAVLAAAGLWVASRRMARLLLK